MQKDLEKDFKEILECFSNIYAKIILYNKNTTDLFILNGDWLYVKFSAIYLIKIY